MIPSDLRANWGAGSRGNAPAYGVVDAARPMVLRAVLIAGLAAALGIAAWVGDPSGYLSADPALARLLRGMALIKGVVVLGTAGLVAWRFGWPVSRTAAVVYVVGSWVLAGSAMLIWQLTWMPLAAVLFHTAALGLLVAGGRDMRA